MGHPPDHPWWIIESPHYNNDHDGVSIHQPHGCLLNCLFRCRSKKTPKLCTTGLCARNSPVTGEFPAQRASNAENVSILWRHHANHFLVARFIWLIFKTQNFHVFRLTMSHLSRVGSPIRWLGGGGGGHVGLSDHVVGRIWQLGECLSTALYLNKCWHIFNWTLANKFTEVWFKMQCFLTKKWTWKYCLQQMLSWS